MATPQPPLRPPQFLDEVRTYPVLTVRDAAGAPVTNTFQDMDAIAVRIWPGGDQPAIYTTSGTWASSFDAQITITIDGPACATAGVVEGLYELEVRVLAAAYDGQDHVVYWGTIEFVDTPGSGTAPTYYASASDLAVFAPEVQQLQSTARDLSGFLAQRHSARTEFEQRILGRYRPVPGRARRYTDDAGTQAGPYLRTVDAGPTGQAAPTLAQLKAWLDAGKLVATPEVVEANAYYAAAIVFEGQIPAAGPEAQNTYAALGKLYRQRADEKWAQAIVELDTVNTPPTTPNVRIDRDVTWLT